MLERFLPGGLADADGARGDVDPARLQPAHDVSEAAPLDATHEVRSGDGDVLEDQLGGVHALVAELRDGLGDA